MAIERMLPLSNTYQLIGIKRQTLETMDGFAMCCDNCNTAIINQATIRDNFGNLWVVGLDCLKTLLGSVNNRGFADDMLFDFNCTVRDLARMKDAESVEDCGHAYRINYRTKANKKASTLLFKHHIEQFNLTA
jgi:hypothetical protein